MFSGHIKLLRCLGLLSLVSVVFASAVVVSATMSDTWVSQQWGWYRIKADKAYDAGGNGAGVVVALIDTGVDVNHPDLSANIIGGWNDRAILMEDIKRYRSYKQKLDSGASDHALKSLMKLVRKDMKEMVTDVKPRLLKFIYHLKYSML